MLAGGAETHAGFDVGAFGENGAIDFSHALLVAQTVGFDRRNDDVQLVAGRFALQRFFEARYNARVAVNVGHGLAPLVRTVEKFRAAVADFVVKENGVVFGDFHSG